jgi:peptidoglycan/xylan/chitin deacetylase (PgdA/CDA1 family)
MKRSACVVLLCALLILLTASACGLSHPETVTETPAETQVPEEAVSEVETVEAIPVSAPEVTDTPLPTAPPTVPPTPAPTEVVERDPVITLIGGESIEVDADFTFTDPGYYAEDYLGSSLTSRIEVSGEVVPYKVGSYSITYSVTDDGGRSTTVVRHVEVVPVVMPDIIMPPEKTVYLTFDDGPCSYTKQLLDVLKKHDAKATFFIIGERGNVDIIKRAYEEGHAIGVHTYTHEYKQIYKNEQAFFDDFWKTQEVIKEATGSYTQIFRFPGGSANTASRRNKGIMTRLTKIMEDMGYRYFDWNISAGDASGKSYTSGDVKNRVVSGLKRHTDYAVVLQHDIHLQSVKAVDSILTWGEEHGYTFLALDLTSPVLHSQVQN